jgi:hypothetical protein
MIPESCDIDPAGRTARLIFRDGPRGRMLRLVVLGPEPTSVDTLVIENLPVRGSLRELSFDRDPQGHFHLLASTSRDCLYYFRDGKGPQLLASGEPRFFPIAHAPRRAYNGYQDSVAGFRFMRARTRR